MHLASLASPNTRDTTATLRRCSIAVTVALSLLALFVGMLGFSPTTLQAAAAPENDDRPERSLVLDEGHIDAFNIVMDDGEPRLTLKEDVTGSGVIHDPEDVELRVVEEALTDFADQAWVPEDLHGETVYYLPLVEEQGLIWPGWDSQSLSWDSDYASVDINITEVEGPGEVFLWSQGTFGDFASRLDHGSFQLPGTIHQESFGHEHAHWAFSEPGQYEFTVHAEVHNPETGESATTNTGSYLFIVGDDVDEPTPDPTVDPTDEPTTEPTQTPTAEPTDIPTDQPTVEPTPEPTDEPTEPLDPTPTATDTPSAEVCWAEDRFETGHVDAFNLTMINGDPTLTLKEDVTGSQVIRDPLDVELHVKEAALIDLPTSDAVPEDVRGQSVYFLPLVQDPNLLWPGWDSQGLAGSGYDTVDINIEEIDGPGEVYLWGAAGFSGEQSLLADDGYQLPGTIDQDYLAHVHANWAFTEPGAYYFTVGAEVTNSETGETVETNTSRYLFTVGDDLPEDYLHCGDDVPDPIEPPDDPDPTETPGPTSSPDGNNGGEDNNGNGNGGNNNGGNGSGAGGTPGGGSGHGTGGGNGSSAQNLCLPVAEWKTRYGSTGDEASGGAGQNATDDTTNNNAATGQSSTPNGDVIHVEEGHFDIGPVAEDGDFQVKVKDDRSAPPVWRDPGELVFVLGDAAFREASTLPEELDFVLKQGQDAYMIQQIQEPGVPWLGWNTQHETIVNGPGSNGVTMTLDSVDGPGDLALFLNGNFGQLVGERVVDTVGGPTSYNIPANTHQHGNWIFTEAGTYQVTLTMSANGESATDTFTFAVGDTAAEQVSAGAADPTQEQHQGHGGVMLASHTVATAAEQPQAGPEQGLTPDGVPCSLAQTGLSSNILIAAGVGLLAVGGGAGALMLARRRCEEHSLAS